MVGNPLLPLSCQYTSYNHHHYGPPVPCVPPQIACLGPLTHFTVLSRPSSSVPSLLQYQSRGLPANMGSSIIGIQRDSTWPSIDDPLQRR
jgi:hypothetical protein